MYTRALAIDESAQGVESFDHRHPDSGNLAEGFRDMGECRTPRPCTSARSRWTSGAGSPPSQRRTYLNNLAGLYKARQMWDKAAEHYRRNIAIRTCRAAESPDHRPTSPST